MPSQRNQSDSFRYKRATFYQSPKSKVGLAAAAKDYACLHYSYKFDWLRPKLEEIVAAYLRLYSKESRDSDNESDGSDGTGGLDEEAGEQDGEGGGEED